MKYNLEGKKFGKLTVIKKENNTKRNYVMWECLCECGNKTVVRTGHLISGRIKSCGCSKLHKKLKSGTKFGRYTVLEYAYKKSHLHYYKVKCECGNVEIVEFSSLKKNKYGCRECHKWQFTAKGFSTTRIYGIWKNMLFRCYNKKCPFFYRYGGRGIKICDEWKNDFMSFYNWAKNNGYKERLSIDRINNNGNYEPSNCRWATREQQANNTSTNTYIFYKGIKLTVAQWSKKIGIKDSVFLGRLKRNGICEKIFYKDMRNF